jgi:hypothetical protein
MDPLNLLNLPALMERTRGRPEIRIGLIDGPVAVNHPDLVTENIRALLGSGCAQANSLACTHGTFVAGILSAKRGSPAPALCTGCSLLVRPIFAEGATDRMPSAPLKSSPRRSWNAWRRARRS